MLRLREKLKNIYKGKFGEQDILKELVGLKMKDGASFQEHLNLFNSLINELMILDVKIDEGKKANI